MKFFSVFSSLVLGWGLVACGQSNGPSVSTVATTAQPAAATTAPPAASPMAPTSIPLARPHKRPHRLLQPRLLHPFPKSG